MIGKLRKKFILINMALVSSILLAVFVILCYSSYRRNEYMAWEAMKEAMDSGRFRIPHKIGEGRRDDRNPFGMFPICIVTLDQDNGVTEISEQGLTMTDEMARTVVPAVLNSDEGGGILKEYSLRYLVRNTKGGKKIALADRGFEIVGMRTLIVNCVFVFIVAMIPFLILSIFLARWALNPVEKAWEQQNQFIADASHELKTPLTVILANLGILSSHKSSTIESQYKWLQNTKDEAGRMKQLVEQLLFLARFDAGSGCGAKSPAEMERETDFSNLVWSCILPFESVAFEQNVSMEADIASDVRIVGNEGQLKQLVAILVDNACKYAGECGKVQVRVFENREKEKAVLEVENTGEPIPKEEISHIFERFYRTDKSRARKEGGYGLGLAIAKTIAEQHRAKISVESSAGEGTRFKVVFHSGEKPQTNKK